jgi:hypothetical protein
MNNCGKRSRDKRYHSECSFKKQSSFIAEEPSYIYIYIYTVAVSKAPPSSCYLVSKNAMTDGRKDARGIT